MADNIIERAVVPYNPSPAQVEHKNRYNLFAPVANIGKVGMAGYDANDFEVSEQIVKLKDKWKITSIDGGTPSTIFDE